jgi:hypothetical protein
MCNLAFAIEVGCQNSSLHPQAGTSKVLVRGKVEKALRVWTRGCNFVKVTPNYVDCAAFHIPKPGQFRLVRNDASRTNWSNRIAKAMRRGERSNGRRHSEALGISEGGSPTTAIEVEP